MSQKFYTLITQQGAALLANATALGKPLKLSKMAVGDANGNTTTPNASQTKLIHKVYQAPLNSLTIDEKNPNQIIAELVIPENQGGWFINEIGLYDESDTLVAVGNCPATYKPQLSEGSGRTQVIRMIIVVDNVNAVALKIDPSVVLATRQYVDDLITSKMTAHEKSTNHPNATTSSKGFVQLNSAIDSNLENQAATPLAVKKAYDLAKGAVKKTGDTMMGELILSKNGLKINYDNKNIMALVTSDDNYSHVFYNAEKKQWLSKLIYNSTTNSWNFQYIDDVAINGKSALKAGDYGIGSLTGTPMTNPDERLLSGWYATKTSDFHDLSGNDSATLAVYGSSHKNFYVEQLFTVASKTPRIFSRCATSEGKQSWYESITTANVNNYIPIGVPLPWPTNKPPEGWLECNGSWFDKNQFPKLAAAYPNGSLPDLRGVFIRGKDNGRGLDPNRAILSYQGDAIRNITGVCDNALSSIDDSTSGAFYRRAAQNRYKISLIANGGGGEIMCGDNFDASRVVPTANENRPRNIAFMYIVKAE
ncbi:MULTISPECIES: phage tail protein [unclassified Gilliamella]|uniref:phage tail-collar fiber domain-containing protein n=1 Tax=unclassified Gilliamella TaxID=2685620 RepID=UPI000A346AA6|nr:MULTISPECIES: phage tail protein [unclassified Gilliamella]OTQ72885.1 hypothetical protein B6C99_09885 [Gilliamella sp. N-G2]OTQ78827.1 hypothetical protein B6D23_07590 [Gilliamella sp. N-W3]